MTDDLREYMAALPGAETEPLDAVGEHVFDWGTTLTRTQIRANAHKLLIGRALKAKRTTLSHGEASEWFEDIADRLGRTRRTLSTWMRVANALEVALDVADQIGRKLPVSILDRRFDEIPAALTAALGDENDDSLKRTRVPSLKACIGLMQTRVEASAGNIEELRQLEAALVGMLNTVREAAAGLPAHEVDLEVVEGGFAADPDSDPDPDAEVRGPSNRVPSSGARGPRRERSRRDPRGSRRGPGSTD